MINLFIIFSTDNQNYGQTSKTGGLLPGVLGGGTVLGHKSKTGILGGGLGGAAVGGVAGAALGAYGGYKLGKMVGKLGRYGHYGYYDNGRYHRCEPVIILFYKLFRYILKVLFPIYLIHSRNSYKLSKLKKPNQNRVQKFAFNCIIALFKLIQF